MKKTLAIILSIMLLLSLIACGKTEVPKEDDKLGISVDDKKPDDSSLPFESGILPTHAGAFYEDLTLENYDERKNEIPDAIVTVLETTEQCNELIHPEYFTYVENGKIDAVVNGQIMADTVNKYTDAFLAEKQVIAVTCIRVNNAYAFLRAEELVLNEDGTYSLNVAMVQAIDSTIDGTLEVLSYTITIEVDKSLGITPENLTVEVIDKTK